VSLRPILKAVYGALVAGVAAALAYAQGGGTSWLQGGLITAAATLSGFGVVWGIPNAAGAKDAGQP
jgi:hypothetical protein